MENKWHVKIVIVGDPNTGKSWILSRSWDGPFIENYKATVGADYKDKDVEIDGKRILMQIWDNAGIQKFSCKSFRIIINQLDFKLNKLLKPLFIIYLKSDALIIVYDVTNQESFENIKKWLDEIRENITTEIPIFLCGNKTDLSYSRVVSPEKGIEASEKYNIGFIEISAKEGTNVPELFDLILYKIKENNNM